MKAALAFVLALSGAGIASAEEVASAPGAMLRGLDKVSGETVDIELSSGQTRAVRPAGGDAVGLPLSGRGSVVQCLCASDDDRRGLRRGRLRRLDDRVEPGPVGARRSALRPLGPALQEQLSRRRFRRGEIGRAPQVLRPGVPGSPSREISTAPSEARCGVRNCVSNSVNPPSAQPVDQIGERDLGGVGAGREHAFAEERGAERDPEDTAGQRRPPARPPANAHGRSGADRHRARRGSR